jgi:hypothetical protein
MIPGGKVGLGFSVHPAMRAEDRPKRSSRPALRTHELSNRKWDSVRWQQSRDVIRNF